MARRVLKEEVSGRQVWGRLKLSWMDDTKVAFGSRGMKALGEFSSTMHERYE